MDVLMLLKGVKRKLNCRIFTNSIKYTGGSPLLIQSSLHPILPQSADVSALAVPRAHLRGRFNNEESLFCVSTTTNPHLCVYGHEYGIWSSVYVCDKKINIQGRHAKIIKSIVEVHASATLAAAATNIIARINVAIAS